MATKPYQIPWKFLLDDDPPKIATKSQPATKPVLNKSFAQALNNVCDIPQSQLPKPSKKGDNFAISIPDDEYDKGMEACKYNLHARILWPKGSTPLTVVALRTKLQLVWKNLGRWGITSLGKGFYEFTFTSIEDANSVRSVGSWNLNPGILKLFAWTTDFNPSLLQNSTAQVWVRIYGLSQEYWRPKILFAIASSVGTPLCTDAVTSKPAIDRTFGHFARVLVDMDLSKDLKYKVLVERKGFAFFVELGYDNLPAFCNYCKITGHSLDKCRKWNEANKPIGKTTKEADRKGKHVEVIQVDQEENKMIEEEQPVNVKTSLNKESEAVFQDNYMAHDTGAVGDMQYAGHFNHGDAGEDEKESSSDGSEFADNTPIGAIYAHGSSQNTNPSQNPTYNQSHSTSQKTSNSPTTQHRLNSKPSQQSQNTQKSKATINQTPTEGTPRNTPARIQHDMDFLNKSWANLEDMEGDTDIEINLEQQHRCIDQQIAQEIQHNIQDSGFQVVTSKSN